MTKTKSCGIREFRDVRTGKCKNANDVYNYQKKEQDIGHDIEIDRSVKRYTKQEFINHLAEFEADYVAIDLINMVSRKKIDILPQASKRLVIFADYWIKEYLMRGVK